MLEFQQSEIYLRELRTIWAILNYNSSKSFFLFIFEVFLSALSPSCYLHSLFFFFPSPPPFPALPLWVCTFAYLCLRLAISFIFLPKSIYSLMSLYLLLWSSYSAIFHFALLQLLSFTYSTSDYIISLYACLWMPFFLNNQTCLMVKLKIWAISKITISQNRIHTVYSCDIDFSSVWPMSIPERSVLCMA